MCSFLVFSVLIYVETNLKNKEIPLNEKVYMDSIDNTMLMLVFWFRSQLFNNMSVYPFGLSADLMLWKERLEKNRESARRDIDIGNSIFVGP